MDVELQVELQRLNATRLTPPLHDVEWSAALDLEVKRRRLEELFLLRCRARVAPLAAAAPADPDAFVAWFRSLRDWGPGQHDPLFPWLETTATLDQFKWFLRQEVAGEAGFEDLVALTQLKMPERAKLELARNHWDELGRGQASAMHGPMLERLARALDLDLSTDPVPEAIALGNLLVGLAANRHYAFHSIGALGVIELTAPDRARMVNLGLKRLGVDARTRQYYALHATLDIKHSQTWNEEVIHPLVSERPERRFAIAEGALMRLEAGLACFTRYRRELGVPA